MAGKLVPLTRYSCVRNAQAAKTFLASYGVRAVIGDGSDPQPPASADQWRGVVLSIAADRADRAKELFNTPEGDTYAGGWICLQCGEAVSVKFAVCWRCGTSGDGQRDPTFLPNDPDSNDEFNDSQSIPEVLETAVDTSALDFREPREDEPAWTCQQCGKRVAEDEAACWNCGATSEGRINPFASPVMENKRIRVVKRKPLPDDDTAEQIIAVSDSALTEGLLGIFFPPSYFGAVGKLLELWKMPYRLPERALVRVVMAWFVCAFVAVEYLVVALMLVHLLFHPRAM